MKNSNEIINFIKSNNIELARNRIQQYYKDSKGQYFYYMGLSFCAEGDFSKAVDCFKKAEKSGLIDYKLFYNIGTSSIEIEDYSMAEVYFKKSLKLNNGYEECYINLAYLYYRLGDVKRAYRTIKSGMTNCSGNKLKYIELRLISILGI